MHSKFDHRIIHIISGDLWGGAEAQAFSVISAIKQRGFDVRCVLFNDGMMAIKLRHLKIPIEIVLEGQHSSVAIAVRIKELICAISPSIIHVHDIKEHFVTKLGVILSRKKTPIVRTVHSRAALSWRRAPRQMIRSIAVYSSGWILKRFSKDCFVAVSRDIAKDLDHTVRRGFVKTILNGVTLKELDREVERDEVRRRYNVGGLFWIGTAVRLVDIKNIPMLIAATKRIVGEGIPCRVSVFGDGPLRQHLFDLIRESNLTGVILLHGFEADILPVMHSLDAFVLSSFHEGMPIALLEAMGIGLPVVCTEVGGMKEIIQNCKNGILIPSNDDKSLAIALKRLFDDPAFAKELSINARETIKSKYSTEHVVKDLIDVYDSLICPIGAITNGY
ncbi:MAG: glycosyltransferase family 4 protein [Syntrophales bacterium]|nr:glycosyltransferase family 4 protein [Syntrophales bacterium]